MENRDALTFVEKIAESLRLAIAADDAREDNQQLAAKADQLRDDIQKKAETLKNLDAQLRYAQDAVEKYEAVHGKIQRLSNLEEQIKIRTGELQKINRDYTQLINSFKVAS